MVRMFFFFLIAGMAKSLPKTLFHFQQEKRRDKKKQNLNPRGSTGVA